MHEQLRCEVGAPLVEVDENRHLGLQRFGVHGLEDVVDRTDLIAPLHPFPVIIRRGQEHDGSVPGALELADQGGGFEPVHLRHAHVQQDEREGGSQDPAQRLPARGRGHHVAVRAAQQRLQRLEAVRLVIDDENIYASRVGQAAHRLPVQPHAQQ